MADEVAQFSSSPQEDPPSPKGSPLGLVCLPDWTRSLQTNSLRTGLDWTRCRTTWPRIYCVAVCFAPDKTLDKWIELDCLRESYSFPPSVQIKLPKEDENIASTHLGEVTFYEVAFYTGLYLPLHPIIRRILYFYNICPAQLILNGWQSLVCVVVVWRAPKFSLSLNEFRSLFSLNKKPKSDSEWLYFKARSKNTLLGGTPTTSRDGRRNSSFSWKTTRSFPQGHFQGSRGRGASQAEVNKLELDRATSQFFQGISEVMVLTSSLAFHVKKMRDEMMIQEGWAASIESEITRAQKLVSNLEGQLTKLKIREQQAIMELKKIKEDRDATVVRLEAEVAIEEFKSSDDF
ncbi:hypothetical protein Acr_00g0036850 [Actinidia rufa]|uniref:Uncharacterized protein n=1 Tax=Actinidia rufa TaxID=165716 RepID=A0A7J0DIL0_9ERIC|nr:hypothetical protein Acr_00g0036850 [Actinidia rufa]